MYTEILAIQYIIKCIHRSTYIQHTQTIYYYASIYCNTQFITYYIHISCTVHLYTMIKRQPSTLRRLVVFIRRDPTSVSPSSSISSASWQKIHRNSWDGFHLTSLETISKHTQSYRKPIKMISFYVLERILIIHIILIIHRVTGQPPKNCLFGWDRSGIFQRCNAQELDVVLDYSIRVFPKIGRNPKMNGESHSLSP